MRSRCSLQRTALATAVAALSVADSCAGAAFDAAEAQAHAMLQHRATPMQRTLASLQPCILVARSSVELQRALQLEGCDSLTVQVHANISYMDASIDARPHNVRIVGFPDAGIAPRLLVCHFLSCCAHICRCLLSCSPCTAVTVSCAAPPCLSAFVSTAESCLQFHPMAVVKLQEMSHWVFENLDLVFPSLPMFNVNGAAGSAAVAHVDVKDSSFESFLCEPGDDAVMMAAAKFAGGATSV